MTPSEGTYGGNEKRLLVLLQDSRDSKAIPGVMEGIGVAAMMCCSPEELCKEIYQGAGAVLVGEEELTSRARAVLHATLESQPSWSELPIVVLLGRRPETQITQNVLLLPGDVTLVERPVRVTTLVALIRSALRSRRRQYVVRDQLQALEQSENRYRALFDSIDEGFCTIQMIFDEQDKAIDYRFIETNPAFEKHTGMVDVMAKSMRELAPKLEEHWYETYGQVAVTGQSTRFQNYAEQLNRWFDVYAFRIGQPKERHVAVLFSDITERKRTEMEILRLNTSLAERAAELETANRDLEAFNYTVAHDLRKPLTVINGYCQVLSTFCEDKLDDQCKSYVREAYDGTGRMNRLIDALLNFSQAGHAEPKRQQINLSGIAQEIASELKLAEPERRVSFLIPDEIPADADPALLRIVLSNLFGNAWKYTGNREKGLIEFGMAEIDGQRAYYVRDNGIGFDPSNAEKLFEPFQRLESGTVAGGLGIGLATVSRIIQRHGGEIRAEGEPGKGATFYFTVGERQRVMHGEVIHER